MGDRFDIIETPLLDLRVLQRKPLGDERGYFERMFCLDELAPLLHGRRVAQINHTLTKSAGTVRGMHFQLPPSAETKLVSCIRGEVFDVAVDLRRDSPTFLSWYGHILTPEHHNAMFIPEGFAHGFQTLNDDCELLYLHTAGYSPASECGLNPCDPRLAIAWPESITMMSPRDTCRPMLTPDFEGVAL